MKVLSPVPAPIRYLDGIRFKRVVIAAAERIIRKQDHLDEINVFPVPDGDTGANMAGTMRAVVESIRDTLEMRINSMSRAVAESALMGARGNSGVILAQFLTGFSEGVKDLPRVTPADFIDAADLASLQAFEAMDNPAEGTILTVIGDWVAHLKARRETYTNFQDLLRDSLESARRSLEATTEKLANLKAAGVVDAGAQGFVYLLEGIAEFTEKGRIAITEMRKSAVAAPVKSVPLERVEAGELSFRYCTECMVRGEMIDGRVLRAALRPLGDSLIVAGSSASKRVHVHTNEPEVVFGIVGTHGTVSARKVDDMLAQQRAAKDGLSDRPGLITDSTCDLPEEMLRGLGVRVVPLRVRLDDDEYMDKIDILPEEFFEKLPKARIAQSSQPPPSDFAEAYFKTLACHREAVCLPIASPLSGTWQNARIAAQAHDGRVRVVDSKALAMSLGLVVLEAARVVREGGDAKAVAEQARWAADNVRFVVSLDSLDQVVKGGRISRAKGLIAKALGIRPILEFIEGKATVAAKPQGRDKSLQKLLDLTAERMAGLRNPRFIVGHAGAPEHARRVADELERTYGVRDVLITTTSPVVCIHCGPRCVAIAMLGEQP